MSAKGGGRSLRVGFTRRKALPLTVDVFQASRGTTILDNRRVALFTKKSKSFTWNGRANRKGKRVVDGIYFVRYTMKVKGRNDTRRVAVERKKGRWSVLPAFDTHDQCAVLADAKSERPVYGGKRSRALLTSFRVGPNPAVVSVAVMRGKRTLRKVKPKAVAAGKLYRLSFSAKTLKKGTYKFVVTGNAGGKSGRPRGARGTARTAPQGEWTDRERPELVVFVRPGLTKSTIVDDAPMRSRKSTISPRATR